MSTVVRRSLVALVLAIGTVGVAVVSSDVVRGFAYFLWAKLRGGYSINERLALHGPEVETRLRPRFLAAGVTYPPHELSYVSFKDTRHLEVYGRGSPNQPWQFVLEYPVLGASGTLGPKLMEGDNQVPEGIYAAEYLNPNSRFHLSIRLNYPNEFDRQMAESDGRTKLGGDIMIHGSSSSIGCLAVGDQAAEDLFVLAALVSRDRLRIIVSPTDFRQPAAQVPVLEPVWVGTLYDSIRAELQQYRRRT
jgi:hypothetical protein